MTRAVVGAAVVIGHLPTGLRPRKLGQLQVPAIERKPNVSRVSQSHHVTAPRETGRDRQPEVLSRSPNPCAPGVYGALFASRPECPLWPGTQGLPTACARLARESLSIARNSASGAACRRG